MAVVLSRRSNNMAVVHQRVDGLIIHESEFKLVSVTLFQRLPRRLQCSLHVAWLCTGLICWREVCVRVLGWMEGWWVDHGPWSLKVNSRNPVFCFFHILVKMPRLFHFLSPSLSDNNIIDCVFVFFCFWVCSWLLRQFLHETGSFLLTSIYLPFYGGIVWSQPG